MKIRIKIAILMISALILLSACQQKDFENTKKNSKTEGNTKKTEQKLDENNSTGKTSEKKETNNETENKTEQNTDIDKLFEEIRTANQSIKYLKMDALLNIITNNTVTTKANVQHMYGDVEYEPTSSKIKKAAFQRDANDGIITKFEFLGDKDYTFRQTTIDSNKKTQDVKEQKHVKYEMHPDYYVLLNKIYSMKDDLKVKEEGNDYILKLRSQNIDLLGIFQDSYDLKLTGVSQSEVKKDLVLIFDKNTKYFKKINLKLNYNGEKGIINMDIQTKYSDHKPNVI